MDKKNSSTRGGDGRENLDEAGVVRPDRSDGAILRPEIVQANEMKLGGTSKESVARVA
jgi:hypothetical protein